MGSEMTVNFIRINYLDDFVKLKMASA